MNLRDYGNWFTYGQPYSKNTKHEICNYSTIDKIIEDLDRSIESNYRIEIFRYGRRTLCLNTFKHLDAVRYDMNGFYLDRAHKHSIDLNKIRLLLLDAIDFIPIKMINKHPKHHNSLKIQSGFAAYKYLGFCGDPEAIQTIKLIPSGPIVIEAAFPDMGKNLVSTISILYKYYEKYPNNNILGPKYYNATDFCGRQDVEESFILDKLSGPYTTYI